MCLVKEKVPLQKKLRHILTGKIQRLLPMQKDGEMFVRVTAKSRNKKEAAALLCEPVTKEIVAILGDVVYGVNVDSLEQTVVNRLLSRGETVATGGILHRRFGFKKANRDCRRFRSI